MTLDILLGTNLALIAAAMVVLWWVSVWKRNASIVDLFWGCGFVQVAWTSLLVTGQPTAKSLLLTALVSLWGLRLAGYLAWRNYGQPEDYRYAALRQRHGKRFPLVSLISVFGLQGLLLWVISFPVQVGISQGSPVGLVGSLGVAVWLVGFIFEAVGDAQLARFKAQPANRGKVMKQGLWRYTRHPNYFGDFLVWWGLYLVAAEADSWWWTGIGPLLMSFLLIRVSGVRLLENSLRHRVSGYEQYLRETSSFFPWPPKTRAAE